MTDFIASDLDGHLLENAEHRTFTHRSVPALEGIVARQVLYRRLEQRELVRDEGITANEMIPILKVLKRLGIVGEIEQGLEVVGLCSIHAGEQIGARVVFHEQARLDHLRHIGAGQLHAVGEAGLDFREVIGLPFVHLTDDHAHVFLGGHDDPCPPPALGGETFGDGLEIGHQLDVFGDVLANFVDKEVQAEIRGLPFDVGMHLFGKIFDGDAVFGAVLVEHSLGRCFIGPGRLGIGFGNVLGFEKRLLPACLPRPARHGFVGGLEWPIQAPAVEIALELGNVALLPIVAAHLVEHLDKNSDEGVELLFADDIGFLVDVEQNAFRWDGDCPLQIGAQKLAVATLGQEQVERGGAVDLLVFKQ